MKKSKEGVILKTRYVSVVPGLRQLELSFPWHGPLKFLVNTSQYPEIVLENRWPRLQMCGSVSPVQGPRDAVAWQPAALYEERWQPWQRSGPSFIAARRFCSDIILLAYPFILFVAHK